jgi:hypothetical protein
MRQSLNYKVKAKSQMNKNEVEEEPVDSIKGI